MRAGILFVLIALLALPREGRAQCGSGGAAWSVLGALAYTTQGDGDSMDGWAAAAGAEISLAAVLLRGGYRYESAGGEGARLHSVEVGARLPLVAGACVTADALLARAGGLGADDYYTNITVPAGLTWYPAADAAPLQPFAGLYLVYSASDARLFGFETAGHAWGGGALVGARLLRGPFAAQVTVRATEVAADVRPQPLGRLRAEVALMLHR